MLISSTYKGNPLRFTGDYFKPGWKEIREVSGYHKLGEYPERLFKDRYPDELKDVTRYRKADFEGVTVAPYNKTVTTIARITTGSNMSITFKSEDVNELMNNEEKFNGKNFMNWLSSDYLVNWLPLDSNAVALPMPTVSEKLELLDCNILVVEANQIIDNKDGLLSWLSHDKVPMEKGLKGDIYWVIDDIWFYKIVQKSAGNRIENFEIKEYYNHNSFGSPWQVVGGIPENRKNLIIYRNFYGSFFPHANDCLKDRSDYRLMKRNAANPIKVVFQRECGKCRQGRVNLEEGGTEKCSNCGGTGLTHPSLSPGEILVKPKPNHLAGTAEAAEVTEVQYILPPIDALKALDEGWKTELELAEKALNRKFIEQVQSGEAKIQDRHDEESFQIQLGNWVFGQFVPGLIDAILMVVYKGERGADEYTVRVPTSYRIKTSQELTEEARLDREAGLPSAFYKAKMNEAINLNWINDPDTKRKIEINFHVDPLAYNDVEEANVLELNNSVSQKELFAHAHAWGIINEIIDDSGIESIYNPLSWWRDRVNKVIDDTFEPEEIQQEILKV